ncbi:MAG: peptidylprolyl isomerase [Polaromonas sp.]|nr:peptidylprolyl isomerase [Polaromonas sp.]
MWSGVSILKVISKQSSSDVGLIVTQTRARHILMRPNAQMDQAAVIAKLVDFKKRIESKSTDFATIAGQNSQDGSAVMGGQLGWSVPLQYPLNLKTR